MTSINATFTITLSYAMPVDITIGYQTVDGTAIAGIDYQETSGSITFPAGTTSQTVSVPILAYIMNGDTPNFSLELVDVPNSVAKGNDGVCNITIPDVIITDGPMIGNYLVANAYASTAGRGDYFHYNCGTSEGQSLMIYGFFCSYEILKDGTAQEQVVANYYKTLAQNLLDAMGPSDAANYQGTMMRQPIPTSTETMYVPHWLFTAKGPCPARYINYTYEAALQKDSSGYFLEIQAADNASATYEVFEVYPTSSEVQYAGTYTPAYDSLGNVTSITIDPDTSTQNWTLESNGNIKIYFPVDTIASTGQSISEFPEWYIVYGYTTTSMIPEGTGQEAWPMWMEIANGYSSCAPDTLRWFDFAYQKAIEWDDRSGMQEQWTTVLSSMRWSTIKGKMMDGAQSAIYPIPGQPALPGPAAVPYGMYCWSNNPNCGYPDPSTGFPDTWLGYKYWSRDTDGNIVGSVTDDSNTPYQYQFGRGDSFQWRLATDYQYATYYLYVSLSISRKPDTTKGESLMILVSVSPADILGDMFYYDMTNDIPDDIDENTFVTVKITNNQLATIYNTANPTYTLPSGSGIAKTTVIFTMENSFDAKIQEVAYIGGPTIDWVDNNISQSLKGDPIPYAPAATPFTYNGDMIQGQLIEWRGQYMFGYQMPDIWHYYEEATNLLFPNGIDTTTDLPTSNVRTGLVEYVISPTNGNGVAKPLHALLMEQQLRYLFVAQQKFQLDGGARGAFAQCFVLNNSDRSSLPLSPTPEPNTWIYTSDDPNTKWSGYQTRVIESLARLIYENQNDDSFYDCVQMSLLISHYWWELLYQVWPDLRGYPAYNADGTKADPEYLVYSPPTYWFEPSISPYPLYGYEDVHPAALIARAAMYMKMSGDSDYFYIYDQMLLNCWNLLEKFWIDDITNDMFYTWSTDPNDNSWFGFQHGEILTTLNIMYMNSNLLPSGIDPDDIKDRVCKTALWFQTVGVKTVST